MCVNSTATSSIIATRSMICSWTKMWPPANNSIVNESTQLAHSDSGYSQMLQGAGRVVGPFPPAAAVGWFAPGVTGAHLPRPAHGANTSDTGHSAVVGWPGIQPVRSERAGEQ